MPAVALYSKPSCVQCDRTERLLAKKGIEFTKVDVTEDADAYQFITEKLGYKAAPVVVTEDKHWYGFRPDLIGELAA